MIRCNTIDKGRGYWGWGNTFRFVFYVDSHLTKIDIQHKQPNTILDYIIKLIRFFIFHIHQCTDFGTYRICTKPYYQRTC